MGETVAEQNRIELVGLAVHVEIGPREMGIKQRGPKLCDEGEELLDIGILRTPERAWIEPRGGQKRLRIDAATMRRVENEWNFQALRPRYGERRR
jgi:hypothetical protein